jgi:hypothetical protein
MARVLLIVSAVTILPLVIIAPFVGAAILIRVCLAGSAKDDRPAILRHVAELIRSLRKPRCTCPHQCHYSESPADNSAKELLLDSPRDPRLLPPSAPEGSVDTARTDERK